ncbi:hypothetical protein PISMIDRAFT_671616 [Pisolithus microcarpus 441]|uniref:Uncharacterized protein n=1 Tax=Pisolithus microcarpus 441 TaxID=765257 RepID=A0A0C9ZUI9_9AGAM|nr:hypothetical protein PISMIDRAFT_671616 [Pisolithus microcarpus 441]
MRTRRPMYMDNYLGTRRQTQAGRSRLDNLDQVFVSTILQVYSRCSSTMSDARDGLRVHTLCNWNPKVWVLCLLSAAHQSGHCHHVHK